MTVAKPRESVTLTLTRGEVEEAVRDYIKRQHFIFYTFSNISCRWTFSAGENEERVLVEGLRPEVEAAPQPEASPLEKAIIEIDSGRPITFKDLI